MPRTGENVKVHMEATRMPQPLCGTLLLGADRARRLTRTFAEVTCKRCRRVHFAQDLAEVWADETHTRIPASD